MESFSINTTQNVVIRHSLASLGERILAQFLDYVFIASYFVVVFLIFQDLFIGGGLIIYAFMFPVLIYNFVFEIFFQGQSPGKMITKIKVIKTDGSQPSLGSYFLRWIFRFVDISLFSGGIAIITILVNGKGQRLGDIAAGTTVIKLKSKISLDHTIYRETKANHKLSYPQVEKLNDKDITIIMEILANIKRNKNLKSRLLAFETKKAVEKKMNNSEEFKAQPIEFLETVMLDYNYIYRKNEEENRY